MVLVDCGVSDGVCDGMIGCECFLSGDVWFVVDLKVKKCLAAHVK